jgi:ABC-2 type transport system ATP-binding protein
VRRDRADPGRRRTENDVIEVDTLRKEYGELVAVQDISFAAHTGTIFGLLGPNGAGKTTSIGCISGLLTPTAGRVRVDGHDIVAEGRAARRALGVVPQEIAVYEDVSATENLDYWASAYGLGAADRRRRIREVLELTGLADRAREPVKRFSGGMKRRLNFACGIVHEPRVLLLDEPTVGVDPQTRVRLLELVRSLARDGLCVLYTTHYMEEAEGLCDRLAVMDRGRIIAQGSLAELRAEMGERDLLRLRGRFDPHAVPAELEPIADLEIVQCEAQELVIAVREGGAKLQNILAALTEAGGSEVRETTLTQPSLESLFIKLTGTELRDE